MAAGKPSLGRILLGIWITSFAAVPTLVLVLVALSYARSPNDGKPEPDPCLSEHTDVIDCESGLLSAVTFFTLLAAPVTFIAASINALLQNRLSRIGLNGAWVGMLCGSACGTGALVWQGSDDLAEFLNVLPLFAGSGALTGLLYWVIAIRPVRYRRSLSGLGRGNL